MEELIKQIDSLDRSLTSSDAKELAKRLQGILKGIVSILETSDVIANDAALEYRASFERAALAESGSEGKGLAHSRTVAEKPRATGSRSASSRSASARPSPADSLPPSLQALFNKKGLLDDGSDDVIRRKG